MNCIYLDNNATTPLLPAALQAMRPYLTEVHANPASAHGYQREREGVLANPSWMASSWTSSNGGIAGSGGNSVRSLPLPNPPLVF